MPFLKNIDCRRNANVYPLFEIVTHEIPPNHLLYILSDLIALGVIMEQKQPFRAVLGKRFSENTHQIYRSTRMLKRNFNKVAKQHYRDHTLAWGFSCKFAAFFQNTFY